MRQTVKRIAASQAANQPYARPEQPAVTSRFFRAPVPAKSGLVGLLITLTALNRRRTTVREEAVLREPPMVRREERVISEDPPPPPY